MKVTTILGSFFIIGLCRASLIVSESDGETGQPMMTPSPSFEDLSGEGGSLTPLRSEKIKKELAKKFANISPRTVEGVNAEAAAVKKAKGHGSIIIQKIAADSKKSPRLFITSQ
ncbi:MAG: hypothetical protein GW748_05830 [Alphaproteobacteria bacterium]|nr:hypothetical protein [Alphaproteobacteria bacterium]NCQ67246.1 hypothetical protein [Alphaproteobacteria bacterium]NCT07089.1 hypothetical protein [Alphaproteobacteria bacterium]